MAKLTIITAIYNVEPYLRQCLDSLINQTMKDLEYILVDDGSPDNCGAICDEYAARDARIKVIHKENGGLSTAWNCGLEHATGEWVTFCDSDDWVDTDYYEQLFAELEPDQMPDIHIAHGYYSETMDSCTVERHTSATPFTVAAGPAMGPVLVHTLVYLYDRNETLPDYGHVWDKMFRRDFLLANGLQFTMSDVSKCPWRDTLFVFQAICKAERVSGGGDEYWLPLSSCKRLRDTPV